MKSIEVRRTLRMVPIQWGKTVFRRLFIVINVKPSRFIEPIKGSMLIRSKL